MTDDEVLEQAFADGFELAERVLADAWVWGWRRGALLRCFGVAVQDRAASVSRSDDLSEFVERGRDAPSGADFDAEFVVARAAGSA